MFNEKTVQLFVNRVFKIHSITFIFVFLFKQATFSYFEFWYHGKSNKTLGKKKFCRKFIDIF